MKYIIAIGIFQAVLAAFLLFRNRYRTNGDDLLISLIICIAIHLSIKFFIFNFVQDPEVIKNMITSIGFCYVPLLYLYTLKTIRKDFVPASKWYVFIPFVVSTIGYFSTACVLSLVASKGYSILNWYNTICFYTMVPFDLFFLIKIILLALDKLSEKRQERKLIIQLASLFIFICTLSLCFVLFNSFVFHFSTINRSISYTVLIVIILRIITYKSSLIIEPELSQMQNDVVLSVSNSDVIFQNSLEVNKETVENFQSFSQVENVQKEAEELNIKTPKRKETLSQSEMFKILLKLETAMESKKFYTDSELTLDKLAKSTELNKYHISETLNHFVNKPFYTFVNEYRIKQVKANLKELSNKNLSINILELAYEAGFNSKSSFNRYFKEITALTPREYINTLNSEALSS
ncbi:AraC family transcriptional regulator [Flavobacterium sp. GN10]|uniref:AraC family transcriptional regulator n=1 Tax=Flavobacterium tagetis TaxID=2801336 RepID=A0ABS1KGV0_9FLAO|nr:helix-turn-helix domain-containing protein [Flavobacterium tagetis]MBL0738721.1 AraC family transcriptional regulator [Flavobacterium tagetis]